MSKRRTGRSQKLLDDFANRGTVRGSRSVLEAAREGPVYLEDDPPQHRSLARVSLVLVVAVVFVGAAVVLLSRDSDNGSDIASGTATPTTVSQEVLDAATERLMEQRTAGWIPVAPQPALEGITVPPVVWMRAGDGIAPPEYDATEGRVPVYDEMDGVVIGYDYQRLGFVPLEIADSGEFDAKQARIDKYGCDVVLDSNCRLQRAEERLQPGE